MRDPQPTLHFFCGKIAAGKSTLAAKLAEQEGTVLIAEDAWLAALYADRLQTAQDYLRCTSRLREVMGPHVTALLNTGLSVILDFQANTRESRSWMRDLLGGTHSDHRLHVLAAPDALCLDRLRKRNARADHPFVVSEAQFHQFTRHFTPPAPDEGFTLVHHDAPPRA